MTQSDLQYSRLEGNALFDELQLTLRERDEAAAAAAAADARTLKLLQDAEAEKAALCAHVAQLEQTLQQTVQQAAGDRARLGQELAASAAECARHKDLSDRHKDLSNRAQAEVNRMVTSTLRFSPAQLARIEAKGLAQEAEAAALQQRVCAAEAEMSQQRQEAAGLRLQLEEAGRALEEGSWQAGALRLQLHQANGMLRTLTARCQAVDSESRAALEQQQQQWVQYLGEAQAFMAQREQACLQLVAEAQAVAAQGMMAQLALRASVLCAQQQCTMAVELVHVLLVTLGLPLTCVLDMPGGLQLMPTAASPLLAQLVSAMREALPLLAVAARGDSKAVEELLAGTAVGCRAALEGLSKLPHQAEAAAAAAAAAVGSYAEWVQ